MAIYKPPKARWPLAVFSGVLGLLIGLGIGFVLGGEEPDADEGVRLVQQELIAAAAALEVAGIEYAESVDDGRVVTEAEYNGALDALESSRERFETVKDALALLSPRQAEEIATAYEEATSAMEATESEQDVQELLDGLDELLTGA